MSAKTVVVSEWEDMVIPDAKCFDLSSKKVSNCIGCWTCWWKTPGKCIHKDLEDFYRAYVNADQVFFFVKLNKGFVSSNVKALIDRMIPLFLPYTVIHDGNSYHKPRYPKYPDVIFCYDYDFKSQEEYQIFYDYIYKVFEQFYSKEIKIVSAAEFQKEGA